MSGGYRLRTFRRIKLPRLIPGFWAGGVYIDTACLRELSTSILLCSSKSAALSIIIPEVLGLVVDKEGARIGIKRPD